jgi:Fur family ferric uptake transcriptional regulator
VAKNESCIAQFKRTVADSEGRWTHARADLLQCVSSIKGHFVAEDIHQALQRRGVDMALTTVYRNLSLLIRAGIIRRATISDEGGARYEFIWGLSHHDHLVCSRCGKQVEFYYPAIDALQDVVAKEHGFRLQSHHLELVGLCPECVKRDENDDSGAQTRPLLEMEIGCEAVVTSLSGDSESKGRLATLGVQLGRRVRVLRVAPFRGPLLIEIVATGGKVMVARKLAEDIEVEYCNVKS